MQVCKTFVNISKSFTSIQIIILVSVKLIRNAILNIVFKKSVFDFCTETMSLFPQFQGETGGDEFKF